MGDRKDREAGSGKWFSPPGGGGDARTGEIMDAVVDEDIPNIERQRSAREKERINVNHGVLHRALKQHAMEVAAAVHAGQIHEEDEKELAESLAADLEALPPRYRTKALDAAKEIRKHAAEGSRQEAWRVAREASIKIATDMPASVHLGGGGKDPLRDELDPEKLADVISDR